MKALIIGTIAMCGVVVACGTDDIDANDPGALEQAVKTPVTICHATGSETNPYVTITVDDNAVPAHRRHQGLEDIIPAPPGGCPGAGEGEGECPPKDGACGGSGGACGSGGHL